MDHDAQTSRPAGVRAGRTLVRRTLTTTGVVAVFLAGLGVGVALPEDTTELDAANADATRTRQEVADLELELQDLGEANEQLTRALDEVKEQAATSAALDARERRLDRGEARLEDRAAHLDAREQALDTAAATSAATSGPSAARAGDTGQSSGNHGRARGFDRAWANQVVRDIRADLRTVDRRLRTGTGVGSALSLLSDSYGSLAEAGTPAGVDEADYQARLSTLEAFAETAADEYLLDPAEGSARYAVVREQTAALFDRLNAALGTRFRLP